MADTVESLNSTFETQDGMLSSTATAEIDRSEASDVASSTAADKRPNVFFSIWPPTDRTREAVRNRLIETLSGPSILSKRYGTVSREEALDAAKVIEEEAFEVAGKAATSEGDGIEILQVYSKEISKRMLEKVKSRSGESETAPAATKVIETPINAEDAPQKEKTESVAGDD